MDLFNLAAKLTLDSEGFDKGIVGAEKSGKGLASSLEGTFSKIKKFAAGALSVAALKKGFDAVVDLANATSDYGDKVDKQSQALGLSRKAYQEWDYILGQNGASIDSLGVSMKTLNSLVLDAAAGGKESKNAFAKLGLGIHEIEQLEPEKQFEEVVRAFQKMPAGAKKSALAVKIFGRNGMELLPLLNQSSTSIDELRARAEELGIIMSDDAVDASVAYNDAMDDLNRTFNSLKYSVGAKLLPAFTTAVQKVTGFAGKISKAFQKNGIQGVWNMLVDGFKNIKWPTWSDVNKLVQDFDIWWTQTARPALQKGMVWYLSLFGVPQESAEQITSTILTWWDTNVQLVKDVCSWALNLPSEPYDAGNQLGQIIGRWWEGKRVGLQKLLRWTLGLPEISDPEGTGMQQTIREWFITKVIPGLANVVSWFLPAPNMGDADGTQTKSRIQVWWDTKVKPYLDGIAQFTLGLFNIKNPLLMAAKISLWWQDVKSATSLFIDLLPTFIGLPKFSDMRNTIEQWWNNVLIDLAELSVKIVSVPDEWVKTVNGWFAGAKQATINFVSGTIADWIKTINDWITKGVNISVNFLSGNSGNSELGDWQSRQPSGSDFAQTWDVSGGDVSGGFAKGLNYVPFDGFPALLHRGEQVITASQARRNRGISGGSTGIDTGAIASAVSSAIRSAMEGVSVNSYLSGKDITDNVDRDMARKLKARRFAT